MNLRECDPAASVHPAMPHTKRIIPVSEVKPGDSIRIPGAVRDTAFVVGIGHDSEHADLIRIETANTSDAVTAFIIAPGVDVTVGYTNRKAKRQRGKMARRARLAARAHA